MRVAVLGMGRMGRALAGRLLDTGHSVTVWNRTAGRAGALVERGANESSTVADAAGGAEVVMISMTNDAAVTSVLLPDGAPLSLPADAVVVDTSTVAPGTARRLAAVYAEQFAASPILGAPAALAAGQASLVVAGPPAALGRVGALLGDISGSVRLCGDDPGLALVVKLVSNDLLMSGIAVLAEVVSAAQGAGLDNDLITDLLSTSALVAPALRNRLADLVAGDHDGWFPPAMGAKDVGLLVDMVKADGGSLPVAELVRSRYEEAAAAGFDDKDITAVIELLRR
jgi:3-hydroxyisobutyrate dehydrogenase-like beta-hydroxyacid dehydrogenase